MTLYYIFGDIMKIYIDAVLFINFIFDLILLISVNFILRRNKKIYRLMLGSLFGSITMLMLFIRMNILVTLLFKFCVSLIMLLITFGYQDFKYFRKNIIYFYLVSMLLGGGIYFLKGQFSYSNNGLVARDNGLRVSYLIVIGISLIIYFKYMLSFKDLKNNYSNYYRCLIYIHNKVIEVNAFLDTGNKLNDPYSNKSIILITKDKLKDINIRSPIYVPYNSLNNEGILECIKADKIVIDGKESKDFLVGISNKNFFMDGIDCIINNRIMEGLK